MKIHSHVGWWGALIISALGTMAFFMVYVSALVPESWLGSGFIHDVAVGLVGVFLLDGAAYLWQKTLHDETIKTKNQISIANIMGICSLLAAGAMSVSWFLLSMVLVPDGPIVEMAGWLGVVVVIIATFAQFAAWFFYRQYSTDMIQARVQAAAHAADTEAAIAQYLEDAATSRAKTAKLMADSMTKKAGQRTRAFVNSSAGMGEGGVQTTTVAKDVTVPAPAKERGRPN